MIKKISKIFIIPLFLFLYNCQAPTTVVYEKGKVMKGPKCFKPNLKQFIE